MNVVRRQSNLGLLIRDAKFWILVAAFSLLSMAGECEKRARADPVEMFLSKAAHLLEMRDAR